MALWRCTVFGITCSLSRCGYCLRSTFPFVGFDGLESGKGRMRNMVDRIAQKRYRT